MVGIIFTFIGTMLFSLFSFCFVFSLALVWFAMPTLIRVARLKGLVDEPEGVRKLHARAVPTIGGVAVFFGLMTTATMILPKVMDTAAAGQHWGIALAALLVLFFTGLKDDLVGLSPSKKLLLHLLLGGLLIFEGGFRIHTFGDLFGIDEIPFYAASAFSLFVYIVIVNAMNLIDGVDGLAGGVGALTSAAFGALFAATGQIQSAVVAFSLCGSLLGFLRFNWNPAKIFLGDSGSLMVGMLSYVFAVQCINLPATVLPAAVEHIAPPVIAMALLAYPLVDTLRVFTLRIMKGRSPFSPDRNHLHHRMMALGWGHRRTSVAVYVYSLFMAGAAWLVFKWEGVQATWLFFLVLGSAFFAFLPILRKSAKMRAKMGERRQVNAHRLRQNAPSQPSLTDS